MNCTVVIPTKNDELIHHAISSVPEGVEIVVGLSNSPNYYIDCLKASYGSRIKLAYSSNDGMPAALNCGVEIASNNFIIILDSDCYLASHNTLNEYIVQLEFFDFVRGITLMEHDSYWSRIAAKGTEAMNKRFAENPRLFGPSIAFKREAFIKYGGYDEGMVSGSCDHEFCLRIEKNNEVVGTSPNAIIIHKPLSFQVDIKSHYGYGKGMRFIDYKYGTWYGLGICMYKIHPFGLFDKLFNRGPVSYVRSILLCFVMLVGYVTFSKHRKK